MLWADHAQAIGIGAREHLDAKCEIVASTDLMMKPADAMRIVRLVTGQHGVYLF